MSIGPPSVFFKGMCLVLFWCLAAARRPVILVPGLLRGKLRVTTDQGTDKWYCGARHNQTMMWCRARYIVTPLSNCMLDYLKLVAKEENGDMRVTSADNVTVTTDPPGDVDALRHTGSGPLARLLHLYLDYVIDDMIADGWVPGKDLFGAPYDWRFGFSEPFRSQFEDELVDLIMRAWSNSHEKVVLFGHSFGAYFVTEMVTDPRFEGKLGRFNVSVADVIDSLVLVTPSWGGSSKMVVNLWRKRLPSPGFAHLFYDDKKMEDFVGSIAAFSLHIPNSRVYGDVPVIYGPNGTVITGSEILDALFSHERVGATSRRIMEAANNFEYINRLPRMPNIPMKVLYNSGLRTPMGLNLTNWDSDGDIFYTSGDGTVMTPGVEHICNKWKEDGADITCLDLAQNDNRYQHTKMLTHPHVREILLRWFSGAPQQQEEL